MPATTIGNTKHHQSNKTQKTPIKRKRETPDTAETETEKPRTEDAIKENTKSPTNQEKRTAQEKELTTRENRKQEQKLTYGKERKALITMENGPRTMNIAILNPESMKEEQMQRYIVKDMTRFKIHISAIQETHITQYRDYLLGNYRIITA